MFALTDETGAVVERYDYGDFGEPEFYDAAGNAISGTAYGNPYLFTGRRFDPESGFYYYRARYYDPRVGQFTTRDPIGVWGDPLNMGNAYAYCGNNPWSFLDPYGLVTWQDVKDALQVFWDGPGAACWCLANLFRDGEPPITAEEFREACRAREARKAASKGAMDAAESSGHIPPRAGVTFPYNARYAVSTGLEVGGGAITFASLPVSFMACPAVVFTGDGLFILYDSADGHVDPMYMTFWVLGGTLKARQVMCGNDLARISRNTVWQQHHWWPEELGGADRAGARVAVAGRWPNLHTAEGTLHPLMREYLINELRAHDWEHATILFRNKSFQTRHRLLSDFYSTLGMTMPEMKDPGILK